MRWRKRWRLVFTFAFTAVLESLGLLWVLARRLARFWSKSTPFPRFRSFFLFRAERGKVSHKGWRQKRSLPSPAIGCKSGCKEWRWRVKAKNGKYLTRAHARRVHFLQANVTFLIAVGKRISKAKKANFIFSVFISLWQFVSISLPKLRGDTARLMK